MSHYFCTDQILEAAPYHWVLSIRSLVALLGNRSTSRAVMDSLQTIRRLPVGDEDNDW